MTENQPTTPDEIWKAVPGYSFYEASNFGRVRSWRNNRHGWAIVPRILKPGLTPDGVWTVCLSHENHRRSFHVGRLILITFIGPCPEGLECCHWDDDNQNNYLTNLRWDTRQGNCDDRTRNGNNTVGSRHGLAKLTEYQVTEIRNLYQSGLVSPKGIAAHFNISAGHVRDIVKRGRWKHI